MLQLEGAAILPRLAESSTEKERLMPIAAPFLKGFDRSLSLIWNARQAKVRSIIARASGELAEVLHF